jgi:replicative DNA helicase
MRERRVPPSVDVKTYDQLLEAYAKERGQADFEPVRLGFGSLDAELRGISAGQVCAVAARTAVGKTWLLETIEHNITARPDFGCLALSLEMPGIEWAERALAVFADVAPEQVEAWAKEGELGRHAADFLARMQNARVVDDPVGLGSLGGVIEHARETLGVPLRVVLVDYLGLLGVSGRDAYERASTIAKTLKLVAKQYQVAVIVACQVSRAGGNGSEPVTIEMLRDSGVIEESLDFLVGAWRPEKAANLSPPEALQVRDLMRCAILKNRKGRDGRVVDLYFRPESRRLFELADPFAEALS